MDDIPQWATDEAMKRLNNAEDGWSYSPHGPAVRALAAMIAKHEQAPVDPVEEIMRGFQYCIFPGFEGAAAWFRAELAKRGLQITEKDG